MIITSLKANNVLKYENLELTGLPEHGLIAISGKNESGKSTIGETVCFALFGRTFSLSENELGKIVMWGSNGCDVSMTFRIGPDNHYHIERFLDREGTHSAKFSRVGEEENPIARGVEGVADALFLVLGYEYEEFIDSFYLAQREITAPQPHSHTVKAMAGVAALEYVGFQFEDEIAEQRDICHQAETRMQEIDEELKQLAIKPGHLKGLQNELESVRTAEQENEEKIEKLQQHADEYKEHLPEIQSARASLSRNNTLGLFSLLFGIVFGAFWGIMTRMPESQAGQTLQQLIDQQLPQWNEQHLQGTLYLAIAFAVLLVFSQLRVLTLKSKLNRLMEIPQQLSETLLLAHNHKVVLGNSLIGHDEEGIAEDIPDDPFAEERDSDEEEQGDQAQPPSDGEIQITCERIHEASIRTSDVLDVVKREINAIKDDNGRMQILATNLDRAIYDEEQRLKHAGHLDEEKEGLQLRHDEAMQRIATRDLASELLTGATKHLSQQFNNDVRDLVSRTLPLFTEGRYEHLQINEGMEVSVFSGEKRDFMDLEEISSGTQRQIMLALRLALSQELVNRSVEGDQFVYLDEPFAFFDEARTISSLRVLPSLSDEIRQIFVVAQDFPEENLPGFDVHLICSRDVNTLVYHGGSV
ncbi:MAG: AAA family ATPase [Chromatiales bacterium]|jgi:exonuclease SbcC